MVYMWPVQLSAQIAFCYLQEFMCWSEDAASVGGPACFLPSPAHTLLSTSSSPYVVVVYSNGSVFIIANILFNSVNLYRLVNVSI